MCDWMDIRKHTPFKDGKYLVYAPSQNPSSPFITIAWYSPISGWEGVALPWMQTVTHWAKLTYPENNIQQGEENDQVFTNNNRFGFVGTCNYGNCTMGLFCVGGKMG